MIDRLFRQMAAFDSVTLSCDRCEAQTPLAYLNPVRNLGVGFVCDRCLVAMPRAEYLALIEGRG